MLPIAVLGAGSWVTALAALLARNHQPVHLWGRDVAQMQQQRCNIQYLPDVKFPESLSVSSDLSEALDGVQDILIAVPSHAFRETLQAIFLYCRPNTHLLWATKGLEPNSGKLLHEVVQEELKCNMGVLSGPTFAQEVAAGLPTAITLATKSESLIQMVIRRFHSNTFRVYSTHDLIGVQLGATVKNVLAIAAGIADGLGFGANARCALITRGLAEMMRLGVALGGQQETFMGLSGLGDLILTSTDNQSRNRRFGLALGSGLNVQEAKGMINQAIEGVNSTAEVYRWAKRLLIDMPITEQVYRVLYENLSPREAVEVLFARPPKNEKL